MTVYFTGYELRCGPQFVPESKSQSIARREIAWMLYYLERAPWRLVRKQLRVLLDPTYVHHCKIRRTK